MKPHTKRLIAATFITPWVVVPVTALFSLWYLFTWLGKSLPDPGVSLVWPNPFKPWETIFLYSLFGVPTAYASLIVIGLPCYLMARRMNILFYPTAICAAVIACIPAATIYGRSYNFWPTYWFLLCFGVSLAVTFAWIMKDKAEPASPANHRPFGTSGMASANSASRAEAMPEASGDS